MTPEPSTPLAITVSLEWAKKLKAAGWDQSDSLFYWFMPEGRPIEGRPIMVGQIVEYQAEPKGAEHNPSGLAQFIYYPTGWLPEASIAMPTAEEILRRLPDWCYAKKSSFGPCEHWIVLDQDGHVRTPAECRHIPVTEHDTLANAAAAMFVFLAEQKLSPTS